jgi:hypothetical protein
VILVVGFPRQLRASSVAQPKSAPVRFDSSCQACRNGLHHATQSRSIGMHFSEPPSEGLLQRIHSNSALPQRAVSLTHRTNQNKQVIIPPKLTSSFIFKKLVNSALSGAFLGDFLSLEIILPQAFREIRFCFSKVSSEEETARFIQ